MARLGMLISFKSVVVLKTLLLSFFHSLFTHPPRCFSNIPFLEVSTDYFALDLICRTISNQGWKFLVITAGVGRGSTLEIIPRIRMLAPSTPAPPTSTMPTRDGRAATRSVLTSQNFSTFQVANAIKMPLD